MKFRPLTKDEKNKVCLDFEMFRKNGTVINSKINFLRSKTNSAASTPSSSIRNFSVAELNQIGLHVGSYATLSEKYRQFEEGQCAIAKWKNNRNWYNVVISRKINDFYFELLYEDGDIDKKVHISKIRHDSRNANFVVVTEINDTHTTIETKKKGHKTKIPNHSIFEYIQHAHIEFSENGRWIRMNNSITAHILNRFAPVNIL